MCKSQADGGQRCASHTRARFQATPTTDPRWDDIAADYASTPEGETVLRSLTREAVSGNDYDTGCRYANVLAKGLSIREANKAAADAIRARRLTKQRLNRNELAQAVRDAQAANPDGWAVDPEDTLGSLEEPLYEVDLREGRDAALEYLRTQWHHHRVGFLTADPADTFTRGRHAALLVECENLAQRFNLPVAATS